MVDDYADAHDDIDKFRALYPNFNVLHEHDVGKGELVEAPPQDLLQVLEAQIAERRASLLKENLGETELQLLGFPLPNFATYFPKMLKHATLYTR